MVDGNGVSAIFRLSTINWQPSTRPSVPALAAQAISTKFRSCQSFVCCVCSWRRSSLAPAAKPILAAANISRAKAGCRMIDSASGRAGQRVDGLARVKKRYCGPYGPENQTTALTFFTIAAASMPAHASNSSGLPERGNARTASLWTLIPSALSSPATASPKPPSV